MPDIWTPGGREPFVLDVQPNPEKVTILPDGRRFVDNTYTLTLEQAEAIWQGYMCAACLEPQDEAFPEECRAFWCKFPMRAEQRKQLERDFKGVDPTLVGSFPLDRELEHLDRVAHEKEK